MKTLLVFFFVIAWLHGAKAQICALGLLNMCFSFYVVLFIVPASIIDELSSNDVNVQEGETVALICNVTGIPYPEVTWFRRPTNSPLSERDSTKEF